MNLDNVTNKSAIAEAQRIARFVFTRRGNKREAHLSEQELAALLAFAFQQGAAWALRQAKAVR